MRVPVQPGKKSLFEGICLRLALSPPGPRAGGHKMKNSHQQQTGVAFQILPFACLIVELWSQSRLRYLQEIGQEIATKIFCFCGTLLSKTFCHCFGLKLTALPTYELQTGRISPSAL